MKVMTFNIASTIGTDKKSDWRRTADIIKAADPDVAGCQEVTVHEDFEPDLDTPALFRDYLKLHVCFGRATSRDSRGDYGVLALSKHRLEEVAILKLPNREGYEQRICLIVRVCAAAPYYFLVTHFPTRTEYPGVEENRQQAIRQITEAVANNRWHPAILVGDFNMEHGTPTIHRLHEDWDVCNDRDPLAATHRSGYQLDFICTYPKRCFSVNAFAVGEPTVASDHRPVTAGLELQPPAATPLEPEP